MKEAGSEFKAELKASTKAEIMEEHCLLAYPPQIVQPPFFYYPGPPTQGWYHSPWTRPSSTNH